jgi:hypothetical protein
MTLRNVLMMSAVTMVAMFAANQLAARNTTARRVFKGQAVSGTMAAPTTQMA